MTAIPYNLLRRIADGAPAFSKLEVFGPSWANGTGSDGLPSVDNAGGYVPGSRWWEKLAGMLHCAGPNPSVQVLAPTPNAVSPYPPQQRPTNLSIGGSQVCQATKGVSGSTPTYATSGDGGAPRVLQLIGPPITTHALGQPYLSPVSLFVMLAMGYNDMYPPNIGADATHILTTGNLEPVCGALRSVLNRFVAAHVWEDTDAFFTYGGSWNPFGALTSLLENSGAGYAYSGTDGATIACTVPSDAHSNCTLDFGWIVGLIGGGSAVADATVSYLVVRNAQVAQSGTWDLTRATNAIGGNSTTSSTNIGKRLDNLQPGDTITLTCHPKAACYAAFDCGSIRGLGGMLVIPSMPTFESGETVPSNYYAGVPQALNACQATVAQEYLNCLTPSLQPYMGDDLTKLVLSGGLPNYHPNNAGHAAIARCIFDAVSLAAPSTTLLSQGA